MKTAGRGGDEPEDSHQRVLEERVPGSSEDGVLVWWLGAHGGAGESTLARLFKGTRAAEHRWPVGLPDGARSAVVLVARTNFSGMTAVQAAMREWDQRERAHVSVLGLVLVAHRPGRLPKDLQRLQRDLLGATERTWLVPWCERWSAGEIPSRANSPKAVEQLCADLAAALDGSTRKVGI